MIGRKVPCAGKKRPVQYGEFKRSKRVLRKLRRAKRARKRRNGWMFGRKIVIRPQMVPVYYIPPVRKGEPEIVTGRDKNGYEYTIKCNNKSSMPRPPPPQKPFVEHHDPSYNDVFKFFGDLADYNINEVVFTLSNEPGSIPIDDKLSFIPPTHLQGWERAVTYDYVSSPQGISVRVA